MSKFIRQLSLLFVFLCISLSGYAQTSSSPKQQTSNKYGPGENGYHFTTLIDLGNTSIKNQANSGTCWSYSTNSFLESEMIRKGEKPVNLAKMFTARNVYYQKAINYVRMHGALNWGQGGEPHDVINMYAKYGAIPQSVYTGLHYGTKTNNLSEMSAIIKGMLDAVIKNPNGTLTPDWKIAVKKVLDTYLGKVPEHFKYKGKTYTPKSFAKKVVKLNPNNYVEFISETNRPYFKKAVMMVPDNWAMQSDWNIPMDDLTKIVDSALKNGYTVAWGTDVSEPYFSWKEGVAYVPETPVKYMTQQQKQEMFDGPKPERKITPKMRQRAFNDYNTTDDHGMQIVGLVKDQNGREYYKVKNSWGTNNEYQGYVYVTKNYLKFKTTSILVNKHGLPKDIAKKLNS